MSDDELTRLFDAVRADHVIDVMQPGLLACTCGERLAIVYGDDGAPCYNPAIRHHHEQYAAAVGDRLAAAEAREAALREAVEGLVPMLRDYAEKRAETACQKWYNPLAEAQARGRVSGLDQAADMVERHLANPEATP